MAGRKFEFETKVIRVGTFLPTPAEGQTERRFVPVLQDGPKAEKICLDLPAELRIDLGMAILQADGAAVSVKLSYSRPKKGK